jgi:hypothetical protein
MIADELNINERTAHQTVSEDLNMRHICPKIVPNNYDDDQVKGYHFQTFHGVQEGCNQNKQDRNRS